MELKQCPFCGGNKVIVRKSDGWACQPQPYEVYCFGAKCQARGPINHSKTDAIQSWNRRA